MPLRRRIDPAVGLGPLGIPYDQSGGAVMPGMQVPEPGGAMRKMQFEFADPAEQQMAAQQAQAAQQAIPPAGMQPPPQAAPQQQGMPPQGQPPQGMPMPGQDPQQQTPMLAQMGQQPQGGDSSMFSDQDLASLVGGQDPLNMMGEDLSQAALGEDPQAQMMLMEAARRRMGA
jgi:hypothetical protein